jgi:UDP-GlcNAc:undecaprenyl-phosphate/decaprenyl-phosphate GlcNAc-1-phosphate transferase
MRLLLILGLSSFLFALILTPLCRNLLRRLGMVDHPDQKRKLHLHPVATMGGIPIVLAYLSSFGVLLLTGQSAPVGPDSLPFALRLTPALVLIFFTGLLDDRFRLQPFQKLLAQIVAGGWAFWAGVRITGVTDQQLPDWLSLPVTVCWLILCTNAFNLIDGVDGLATGVGLFSTATMLIAALLQHNLLLALATVPLTGALLGFLRYNFNPATIFLGDSGSLFIGFLLGCFGAIWSQKSATILGMTAPLMALSIPIVDLCLSIVRRFLRRKPVMRGDRDHIHHRLLDRGLSARRAVVILYGLCAVAAVLSLFQSTATNHTAGAVIVIFCGIAWIGIQNLGYAEFSQARRMILAGGFRQALNSSLEFRAFDQSLSEAQTREQRWAVLRDALKKFGLVEIQWFVEGKTYHDALWNSSGQECWSLRIPLSGGDYINFTRVANLDDASINVGALVAIVRKTLSRPPEPAQAAPTSAAPQPARKPNEPAFLSQNQQMEPNLPRKA